MYRADLLARLPPRSGRYAVRAPTAATQALSQVGGGGVAVRSPGGIQPPRGEPMRPPAVPALAALLREPRPAPGAQPPPRPGTSATARRCCLPDHRASG